MGDGDEISKELGGHSSSSHHCSSGPNATNADTRMKFASVDAISELVWSPRNGLCLRCADFSYSKKPKLLSPNFFDIEQTNMAIHSNSTSIEQRQEEENGFHINVQFRARDQVNQACSEKSCQMNRPLSGIGGSVKDIKPEIEEMVVDKIETSDGRECNEAGCSKKSSDSPGAIGRKSESLLANEKLRLESAGSQEEPTIHGVTEEENKTNNRVDHLESMDENNLATLAVVACEGKGEYLPEDETDHVEKAGFSGSHRRLCAKAKGKQKALSDGNFDGDDADDESFGSVESCNSAGLLSRGKKRPDFEQQLILRSKRLKTLGQECFGSTSKLKQDSSFMNWISNMTKGIWKGNEEDNSPFVALTTSSDANGQLNAIVDHQELSPCCLKEDIGCGNTGFQSFFKSIYCPTKRSQNAAEMDFTNDANAPSLQALPWIPEQCEISEGDHLSSSGNEIGPVAEPNISSEKNGFNQTSETFSSEDKHKEKEPNISLLSLSKSKPNEEPKTRGDADGKVSQCLTNRNSGLESLWISRFSSKSSVPQKKAGETAKEANDSASDGTKKHDLQKMQAENNVLIPSTSSVDRFDKPKTALPVVSALRIDSSDAVASLFARRLEAMKRIITSGSSAENSEEEQKNLICFYCGKKDHCLRECLEVTDTELRDLVLNISAWNEEKEAASLCIKCFQLSHWAATCPNAPLYSSGAEDRAMKHALASTSGTKLPWSSFTGIPKAVFDAIQVLRLTRTDVLKWINTKKSVLGLEGFFLRLRVGKWQEGLGGTGYYVARIDGDTKGQSSRRHSYNNSISVKVKGITCLVESQFISNQDFLEEELKAWWENAGKHAGRSGSGENIPSAEELSRKIQERKMIGF